MSSILASPDCCRQDIAYFIKTARWLLGVAKSATVTDDNRKLMLTTAQQYLVLAAETMEKLQHLQSYAESPLRIIE